MTRDGFGQSMGSVGAEPIVSGTSWGALTLEVGKSPTEVPPARRLCHAASGPSVGDFRVLFVASSPSWSPNRAVFETGAIW